MCVYNVTMNDPKPLRNICIVGNIGSGKSTLARFLGAAIPHSICIPENFDSNPFLKYYVANPPRWAFTNALRYFYDYARVYHELTVGRAFDHHFIDAGGATNRHVYVRYALEEKVMTPEENAFYETLCEMIERAYAYPEPDAYIFVESSPEACFARMQQRGWGYQTEHIELGYIVALRKYFYEYRVLLQEKQIPVLVLDSDILDFTSEQGRAEVLSRVRAFLAG
jgi:deoxyadenosine/deoxycytidine kinase